MSTWVNNFLVGGDGRVALTREIATRAVYSGGVAFEADGGEALAEDNGTVATLQNGMGFTSADAIAVVDASAALPAGTVWQNGLPFSDDRLCVDLTGDPAYYRAGLPFSVVGGLCVTLSTPCVILTEGGETVITEGGEATLPEVCAGIELREDLGAELREDGGIELR